MQPRAILQILHLKEPLLKECGIKKRYRILIPDYDIYRKLTGDDPPNEKELTEWFSIVLHWLKIFESLYVGYNYEHQMKEARRKKMVGKEVKKLFTEKSRPLYLRASYDKAEKLATYLQKNRLDYLGNPVQS